MAERQPATGGGGPSRRAGELAQPTCSLVGLGSLLAATPGNFAVLIHGDPDCVNPFLPLFPHRLAPDAATAYCGSHRFYHSGLTQADVVAGRGRERALAALAAIAREEQPEVIFVVGSCLSEMIGEELEQLALEGQRLIGVPVVGLPAGGLRLRTQPHVLDRFGALLAGQNWRDPEATTPTTTGLAGPGSVLLLGFPLLRPWELAELKELLEPGGITVTAELPGRASLSEWGEARRAHLAAVADEAAWPALTALLGKAGVELLPQPPPFGLRATELFVTALARPFGASRQLMRRLVKAHRAAEAALAEPRGRLTGKRAALCIGSNKNYIAGELALEGLGVLPAMRELGLQVTVLVQERNDRESLARIEMSLLAMGIATEYDTFNDPGVLREALTRGRYELACCQDHLQQQALAAGVPYVRSGSLRPFFVGMKTNAAMLQAALEGGFQARYRRYLGR